MLRKSLFFTAALALSVMFSANSFAQKRPDPKMYKTGNAEVYAIADSVGETPAVIFLGNQETIKKYIPSDNTPSAVMTFLIKNEGKNILVDTGLGIYSEEFTSGLIPGLEKAGVKAEDINIVLITHMHGDHVGGLMREGKQIFPNAVIKIGRIEKDYWTSEAAAAENPSRKSNFDKAREIVALYGDKVETFEFDDTVIPGITALDASGHTPGHTAFMLESKGKKMLFVADLIHGAALQFAKPDISSFYDTDPVKSAQTREKFLKKAAEEKLTIAGDHLPFPSVGTVKKAKEGYSFK